VPPVLVIVSTWQAAPAEPQTCALGAGAACRVREARADVSNLSAQSVTTPRCLEVLVTGRIPRGPVRRWLRRRRTSSAPECTHRRRPYLNSRVRARYVLLRLDRRCSPRARRRTRRRIPMVEHVLPQTPPDGGSEWLAWWPDEAVRARWIHRPRQPAPCSP
jgi:hypothetical protein